MVHGLGFRAYGLGFKVRVKSGMGSRPCYWACFVAIFVFVELLAGCL